MTVEQQKKFKYWQWRTILGTMIGYIFFYLVRKNFSFALPGLTAEYGITKTALGSILTIAGLVYGLSKLFNGILADRTDGRWHMVTGLAVCTVCSLLFAFGPAIAGWFPFEFTATLIVVFSVLWIINNAFQGCGFPPCSRLLAHWVPSNELSTKQSIWNTSHSIGAFIAAALCGILIMGHMGTDVSADASKVAEIAGNLGLDTDAPRVIAAAQHYGAWKLTFLIPGVIAAFGVIFVIWCLRDTPKSVGLPELAGSGTGETQKVAEDQNSAEYKEFVKKHVFKNPVIWMLAVADFFVYIIRFAVLDWGPTFLQEARGLSAQMSGWTIVIFELFGCFGMLLAGWLSDKLFAGKAHRTCLFCMLGATIFIVMFCLLPESTDPFTLLIILACAGFFIYGPQALLGVIASNQATRKAASTANGVVGFVSYISVAISGVGFGWISDNFGWKWVFVTMIIMAIVGFCSLLPLWNLKRDAYEE